MSDWVLTGHGWLIDRLTEWMNDWLTDWPTDRPTDWLTDWRAGWLTDVLIDWLTNWLTHEVMDWLTSWTINWLADQSTNWLMNDWHCFILLLTTVAIKMVLASWFYKAHTFVLLCAAFFVVVHVSQYEICMVTGALEAEVFLTLFCQKCYTMCLK